MACPSEVKNKVAGLVLVPDQWGLTESVKRELASWAEYGVCAVAVDFFFDKTPSNEREAERWKDQMDTEKSQKAILTALDFVSKQSLVDPQLLGVLGWRDGAMRALKVSGRAKNLKTIALISAPTPNEFSGLKNFKGKVLFVYPDLTVHYKKKNLDEMKSVFSRLHIPLELRSVQAESLNFYDVSRLQEFNVKASERAKTLVRDFFDRFLSLRQHRKEPLK